MANVRPSRRIRMQFGARLKVALANRTMCAQHRSLAAVDTRQLAVVRDHMGKPTEFAHEGLRIRERHRTLCGMADVREIARWGAGPEIREFAPARCQRRRSARGTARHPVPGGTRRPSRHATGQLRHDGPRGSAMKTSGGPGANSTAPTTHPWRLTWPESRCRQGSRRRDAVAAPPSQPRL